MYWGMNGMYASLIDIMLNEGAIQKAHSVLHLSVFWNSFLISEYEDKLIWARYILKFNSNTEYLCIS